MNGIRGTRAQYIYMGHPAMPDIDKDLECNLTNVGPQFTIAIEGEEHTLMGNPDDYRYIVYPKQIQKVRDVEGFITHHTKNAGSLKHLLQNALWAQLLTDNKLENMINCRANQDFERPSYMPKQPDDYDSTWSYHWMSRHIPVRSLIELTITWLKGMIIEAHGVQGFQMIKEAQEEAGKLLKIREEESLRQLGDAWQATVDGIHPRFDNPCREYIVGDVHAATLEPNKNGTVFSKELFEKMTNQIMNKPVYAHRIVE